MNFQETFQIDKNNVLKCSKLNKFYGTNFLLSNWNLWHNMFSMFKHKIAWYNVSNTFLPRKCFPNHYMKRPQFQVCEHINFCIFLYIELREYVSNCRGLKISFIHLQQFQIANLELKFHTFHTVMNIAFQ